MDKEKALNLLKANVYCSDHRLRCNECPLHLEDMGDCNGFNDDDLFEAVKVLND